MDNFSISKDINVLKNNISKKVGVFVISGTSTFVLSKNLKVNDRKVAKKQIGVFSGSFNPIHMGHLILANYITEFTDIDEVWFVVTPHNPLKEFSNLAEEKHRLSMCNIAVKGLDKLKVSEIEFDMPKPSYTIDTLDRLKNDYTDFAFTLIIGADNWNELHLWKSYERLKSEYNMIIYPRLLQEVNIETQYHHNIHYCKAPIVEISSTFIRQSIQENKNIQSFLPNGVYDYICDHKLYK